MATFKRIKRVWALPQCGATRRENYANDEPDTDRQCKFKASYEIQSPETGGESVFLCAKHAGMVALEYLVSEQEKKHV